MNDIQFRFVRTICLFLLLAFCNVRVFAEEKLDAARIHQLAGWLPDQPAAFAWPITNRTAWDKLAALPAYKSVIPGANHLLTKPLADIPDSLFLEYSINGNRTHWQEAEFQRRSRVARFTWAEALENKGRFLPGIEKTIAAVCAEKTWVYPAHDSSLKNFHGLDTYPELGATGLAAELAEADYILGDKLSPATRKLIRDNVSRRVLIPFRDSIEGRRKPLHWLFLKMNWNAVCVGNTVFAALALEPSRDDRAFFAAAGEHYIRNFLIGFGDDGYCAEGIGYWNYGFGHFILLTEALRQATGGKLDLLNDDQAILGALYCQKSEVLPGIFPSISDCTPGARPADEYADYVCRRLGLPTTSPHWHGTGDGLADGVMLTSLPDDVPLARKLNISKSDNPLRSFFPTGGVLISRNTPEVAPEFAVVIKGGNNDEPHNHNDVGSFSVVLGRDMLICDPGGENYTARTFGPHRYDSKLLNSYGHAVPILGGELQKAGKDACGIILETNFSDASDVLKMDYSSAYPVKTLKTLERTFTFNRGPAPSLVVSDQVKFTSPESFETALITWGQVRKIDAHTLEITDHDSAGHNGAVRVTIDTQGRPFKWSQVLIDEDADTKRKPFHVGIQLMDKISEAEITLKIVPVVK